MKRSIYLLLAVCMTCLAPAAVFAADPPAVRRRQDLRHLGQARHARRRAGRGARGQDHLQPRLRHGQPGVRGGQCAFDDLPRGVALQAIHGPVHPHPGAGGQAVAGRPAAQARARDQRRGPAHHHPPPAAPHQRLARPVGPADAGRPAPGRWHHRQRHHGPARAAEAIELPARRRGPVQQQRLQPAGPDRAARVGPVAGGVCAGAHLRPAGHERTRTFTRATARW